jgi:hypothetical protein
VEVEWLILADYAEIIGGKLYLMGGGWDVLTVNTGFPLARSIGLATAFSVPWNETNQRHNVEIEFLTEDGQSIGKVGAQLEVGRPAGIKAGQQQRFQIAANVPLNLTNLGTYVVVTRIEGQESRRVPFNVVEGPILQAKRS